MPLFFFETRQRIFRGGSQRLSVDAGVYTAYKPYLNKEEEIIKQLQKVGSCRAAPRICWDVR